LARGGHIRGDINVLMVGDPSCGKSQMLRFINNIAPHCLTTTGRGSSGVGLTAAVTTDSDTGERRLEAGAMVLADRGIVCIDEFDKMSDADRVSIHEVMEQQTVTIAKAGIHTSLNARCSVLAAANPVYGQYDPYKPPQENVALPDSLLSRFDLLYIMLDKMDPTLDRTLADHVLRSHRYRNAGEADGEVLHMEKSTDVVINENPDDVSEEKETSMYSQSKVYGGGRRTRGQQRLLSVEFARKYILYAKAKCHPVLTPAAAEYIADRYTKLRLDTEKSRTLPVTARTLECMIRLATAHAKSRLSEQVEEIDAKNAAALVHFSYYNEAEPKSRSSGDTDNDTSDDDDDNNGDDGMGSTPKSSQKKKTGARTPRSATKKAAGAAAAASSPKSASKGKGKGKGKASDPADQFDFPEDGEDAEVQVATPTSRKGRAAARGSAKKDSAAAAAAEDDAEEETEEMEATEEPVAPPTAEQTKQLRETLTTLFTSLRAETIEQSALVQELDDKFPDQFVVGQVELILATMADENEVMVVDEQIIKI